MQTLLYEKHKAIETVARQFYDLSTFLTTHTSTTTRAYDMLLFAAETPDPCCYTQQEPETCRLPTQSIHQETS